MKSTDKPIFVSMIAKTWRFYGKTPTGEDVADWFELLESFPLEAVAAAFKRHLVDPKAGQYLPKPADLIRHLQPHAGDYGHPEPDEAWGLLLRLIRDERETGVLTDEMRAGWQACQPILDAGDEVGARRCFLAVYARHVEDARRYGQRARWTVTLGTCPQLRAQRLTEAVQANRLSRDYVARLLPGPSPNSLDQVAGLLEGPDAPRQDLDTARRLRDLAEILRAGAADHSARLAEEKRARQEREAARRAELLGQVPVTKSETPL